VFNRVRNPSRAAIPSASQEARLCKHPLLSRRRNDMDRVERLPLGLARFPHIVVAIDTQSCLVCGSNRGGYDDRSLSYWKPPGPSDSLVPYRSCLPPHSISWLQRRRIRGWPSLADRLNACGTLTSHRCAASQGSRPGAGGIASNGDRVGCPGTEAFDGL